MTIRLTSSGSFKNLDSFLKRMTNGELQRVLERYGQEGVNALASSTPIETGATKTSWDYEVTKEGKTWTIAWTNSHREGGPPVAILLQYGHGTGTGGYVQGRDYINPAMRPIFDKIANEVWKAVTSA